jgi:MarR family 2-MHQ and catechol resistance regulon transcriptional repressor
MDTTVPQEAADRRKAYYDGVGERLRKLRKAERTSAELAVHLIYTHDVLETRLLRYFAAHNLSPASFNVLMILRNSETGEMPLHCISELLLVSRANVTGLVDCLEQRQLVTRHTDARDRRVRMARLTDDGRTLIEAVAPGHYELLARMCKHLSDEDRATLRGLLEKLRHSAEAVNF